MNTPLQQSATGERDELIGRLSFTAAASAALRPMCIAAIDMLEADALEIERMRKMYEQAHQSRANFRQAFREARKEQQVAVPPGYALVPVEPTLEMMLKMPASSNSREWKEYYTAMLAAAQGANP